jgi:hypothetical protein
MFFSKAIDKPPGPVGLNDLLPNKFYVSDHRMGFIIQETVSGMSVSFRFKQFSFHPPTRWKSLPQNDGLLYIGCFLSSVTLLVILRERLTVTTVARWWKRKCFSNNGIEPRRPKNLLYESALKIGFELKRQKKTDRAFGNMRFFIGRLLRTEQ